MNSLDQKFWSRFAKSAWEKKSVTFKNVRSPLTQLNEFEIFDLLLTYSDRCRRAKNPDGMKFYIQGHRQFDSEVLRHLPKKSDKSLSGYHDRMSSHYDDYCLVCDELLQVNPRTQHILMELTTPLFANVGLPNRFVEMGLYLGNYRKTPFGVHEDACGVFSFPVVGKKKFRIWQPAFVKRNPKLARAFSYAKYKDASQVLEAHVGDMTYWPSSAWHIAESDGSFSATWSLGVWIDKKQSDIVSEITTSLIHQRLGPSGNRTMTDFASSAILTGEWKSLPETYLKALTSLKSISRFELESAFRTSWMSHASKNGFKNFPPAELRLNASSQIHLRHPQQTIQWMRDGDAIIYAFNGATIRSKSKSVLKFLISLNRGRTLRVGRILKHVQPLADAGAFVIA